MSLSLTEKHICSSYQDRMLKSSMTQIQTLSPLQCIQALYNTYDRYPIIFVITFIPTSKKFTHFIMNNNM